MATSRVRTGCQNCRLRHLKCDEEKPACFRCQKSGSECVRGVNIRFRHEYNPSVAHNDGLSLNKCEYDFAEDQPWIHQTHRLSFVDETKDLANIYDHPTDNYEGDFRQATRSSPLSDVFSATTRPASTPGAASPRSSLANSSFRNEQHSPRKRSRLNSSFPEALEMNHVGELKAQAQSRADYSRSSQKDILQDILHSPLDHSYSLRLPPLNLPKDHSIAEPANSPTSSFYTTASHANVEPPQLHIDHPQWPLKDRNEASLMRYYIHNIASYLDLCDQERHFALVVPHRAAACPPLLNAIFAASARHQSRVADGDPYIADHYHQECVKHLIPLLNDRASLMDENLLAATIVLRYHEEIEAPHSGTGAQSHLLGTHIFMGAQERSVASGGLRRAAFWVGLRMELFFAFLNSRSILPTLELRNIDRSLDPTDDCTWANRMVVHCAEALRYCFGNGEHNVAKYTQLVEYCDDWMEEKPQSFTPIYYREPGDGEVFPEIWVLGDAVGTGLMHYRLTRILLTAHNPKIPRLGPGQRAALHSADEDIKHDVRLICGIAESNQKTPPYFVKACMAITMAGDRFTKRCEQEALLRVMRRGSELAWPTMTAVRHLKEAWGWEE